MGQPNKLREELAQQFTAALSEGRIPWKACWQQARPENAVNGKPYRGVNACMLSWVAGDRGYSDPRWCTFNQARDKQWHIKKGSKGCPVEYWAFYDREQKKLLSWPEAEKLLRNEEYAQKNLQLSCRTYTVFNAQQIEGIPPITQQQQRQTNIDSIRSQRDTLLKNMGLAYRETGSEAYYSPIQDRVTLPPEHSFFDTYGYACTFLHECGHATGHPSRLNRDMSAFPGTASYAREELRAEIASAFTSQALGLQLTDEQLCSHMELHKAYIQSWAQALKDAPEELFRAIKDAERISDYLIEKGEFLVQEKALGQKQQSLEHPMTGTAPSRLEDLVASLPTDQAQVREMPTLDLER